MNRAGREVGEHSGGGFNRQQLSRQSQKRNLPFSPPGSGSGSGGGTGVAEPKRVKQTTLEGESTRLRLDLFQVHNVNGYIVRASQEVGEQVPALLRHITVHGDPFECAPTAGDMQEILAEHPTLRADLSIIFIADRELLVEGREVFTDAALCSQLWNGEALRIEFSVPDVLEASAALFGECRHLHISTHGDEDTRNPAEWLQYMVEVEWQGNYQLGAVICPSVTIMGDLEVSSDQVVSYLFNALPNGRKKFVRVKLGQSEYDEAEIRASIIQSFGQGAPPSFKLDLIYYHEENPGNIRMQIAEAHPRHCTYRCDTVQPPELQNGSGLWEVTISAESD